jgi:hypothetical protein
LSQEACTGVKARPPPRVAVEVIGCGGGSMTGVTVLNQKHAMQVAVTGAKLLQRLEVMLSIFTCRTSGFHATAVDDQKQQHIDSTVAGILKLLLLDRAGDSPPDGGTFKRLQIGHLIDTDDPKAAVRQTLSIRQ